MSEKNNVNHPRRYMLTAPEFNSALGFMIRLARKRAGISQTRLAKACGTTYRLVLRYENGDGGMNAYRLALIADALGTSLDGLVRDALAYAGRPQKEAA